MDRRGRLCLPSPPEIESPCAHVSDTESFLYADKVAFGGVDRDPQLGLVETAAVNHVPDQFIAGPAPIEYIKNRRIRTLFRDFVPTMFLRDFERFIGVNFQKRTVKNLGGRIARVIGIFGALRIYAGGSVCRINA